MDVGFPMIDQSNKVSSSIMFWRDYMPAYQFQKEINQGAYKDQRCFFFNRSRPPEQIEPTGHFQSWRFLSLQELGWGPPARNDAPGSSCLLELV
jgi:hypothetical protein